MLQGRLLGLIVEHCWCDGLTASSPVEFRAALLETGQGRNQSIYLLSAAFFAIGFKQALSACAKCWRIAYGLEQAYIDGIAVQDSKIKA